MIAVHSTGGARRCVQALAGWLCPTPVETPDPWLLDTRIAELEQIHPTRVRVTIDPHFIPTDCSWCVRSRPEMTSVRVYGSPDCAVCPDDGMAPLVRAEVCHRCATSPRTGPIRQALVEAGAFRVIQVEVCQ